MGTWTRASDDEKSKYAVYPHLEPLDVTALEAVNVSALPDGELGPCGPLIGRLATAIMEDLVALQRHRGDNRYTLREDVRLYDPLFHLPHVIWGVLSDAGVLPDELLVIAFGYIRRLVTRRALLLAGDNLAYVFSLAVLVAWKAMGADETVFFDCDFGPKIGVGPARLVSGQLILLAALEWDVIVRDVEFERERAWLVATAAKLAYYERMAIMVREKHAKFAT